MKKLRIGFFYPDRAMIRPIDPLTIWSSSRGLTGSEISFIMYALELSRMGHSVTLFSKLTRGGDIEGVCCCHYSEWDSIYKHQRWDALCSWMLPDPLEVANPESFRFYNQQVSDFNMCHNGWESKVDFVAPLSHSHARHMLPQCSLPKNKWKVMYNGVDSNSFRPLDKVPGKVVWASSHDRGLHWLLELWPKVRQAVPHANLHVFYDFNGLNMFSRWENTPTDNLIDQECAELGQRSRYIIEALHRLEPHGVFTHQSVSRERICQEMGSAEVLAYPCDPVHYTETFGVTVLEACASGAVPVICTADAFGELWGNVSLSVPPPFKQNKQAFVTNLINILTDSNLREKLSNACVKYAASFDWKSLTQYFSTFLESRGAAGLLEVQWEE